MRALLAVCLVIFLALGDGAPIAFGQQAGSSGAGAAPDAAGGQEGSQAAPAAPVVAQVKSNTLQDGTAVKLRLAETISSATAKTGQQVSFEVTEDVVVQGVTVLPKGAQALASVTDASPKKSMGRGGKLDVNVDSARLADGEKVQLRAVQDAKGGGHTGAMTGAMVATAIVFFPAAPLFLFIHGKDITIPKGTEVTAFVEGDTKLDLAKFVPVAPFGAPVAAATQTASLTVEASVANCDIEIDGEFVGSTPSTLSVAPGKHTVVVKKTGFADWSRSMTVGAGSARLSAEMVAK
jgi:hypothetical protein